MLKLETILNEIKQQIIDDYNTILATLSTVELPLEPLDSTNIFVGYFDPDNRFASPLLFITVEESNYDYESGTSSTLEVNSKIEFHIIAQTLDIPLSQEELTKKLFRYSAALQILLKRRRDITLIEDNVYDAVNGNSSIKWYELSTNLNYEDSCI